MINKDVSLEGWKSQLVTLEGTRSYWKWRSELGTDDEWIAEEIRVAQNQIDQRIIYYKTIIADREAGRS